MRWMTERRRALISSGATGKPFVYKRTNLPRGVITTDIKLMEADSDITILLQYRAPNVGDSGSANQGNGISFRVFCAPGGYNCPLAIQGYASYFISSWSGSGNYRYNPEPVYYKDPRRAAYYHVKGSTFASINIANVTKRDSPNKDFVASDKVLKIESTWQTTIDEIVIYDVPITQSEILNYIENGVLP